MFDPDQTPLGQLPLAIQDAIMDIARKTMAPPSMIMGATLASVALACQQGFRVRRPSASACPLGLYVLLIAESGERKSTVDKEVSTWVKEVLDEIKPRFADEQLQAQARLLAWKRQMRRAEMKLEKSSEEGGESLQANLEEIKEMLRTKPRTPKMPVLMYTDTTPEALIEGMYSSWPNACLHFDEGGQFFNQRLGSSFAQLNHLWGGSKYTTHRKTRDSFDLENYSLSAVLMIQPVPFRKFLKNRGDEAINIGTLPRFLLTMPMSMQGMRYKPEYTSGEYKVVDQCLALRTFTDRLKEIFRQSFTFGERSPIVELEYLEEAHSLWRQFDNSVEYALNKYQDDPSVRAAYAKLGEQIARISAIFHCFENRPGRYIDSYTLGRAMQVGNWYMSQYIKILSGEGEFTIQADAKKLCAWLKDRAAKRWLESRDFVDIPLVELMRSGPNGLRKRDRSTPAIHYAESMGMIHFVRTKPAFFRVHRSMFQSPTMVQSSDYPATSISQNCNF